MNSLPDINLIDGTLSGDDTVIEKPYRDHEFAKLINYYWSGKSHSVIKGINLITAYYTDPEGKPVPVNYRLQDFCNCHTRAPTQLMLILEYPSFVAWQPKFLYYSLEIEAKPKLSQ
ncbi:hypothetical protein NDI37_27290 [Funiculus sociatus GB2-A5]|uniref:Uncharacterized protein n=1 Tax=Funiculus sociatus GB2-A5 TaxID=2933946 RepID=A0ABV0JXF3_9CYAN|nr:MULTISPECIES: hypothetical protein [unclassified Trichocoleus]MBD1908534.1 hypothetical protein [Trichocoleus sp. FACHB-832]MBD2063208.1 hypothetical protein [Trichocoleus sp. FACHB-6]